MQSNRQRYGQGQATVGATSVSFNTFTVIFDSVDIKKDLPGRRLKGSRRVHLKEDAASTEASVRGRKTCHLRKAEPSSFDLNIEVQRLSS